ncbi:bifunctional phosphoribosylaminoimidazolecarboxamide formyltransferase/IMP cyclohydrolase [Kiritimatiella glycovorans]|uniref:Bifunctional purine biosynthesis protein PurH n=1 Tax=Kiritimatiella glycovorans TaxID=1307763 RepID=A0A0G3EFE6_9BACT|nr:bifunctional phosphoribosylaminoimidazolecarboxamide formyltransferase/IMP cyclohydrolase [Kiritimatiella glycovorans]AKJ65063.1 Bifunctional purine biosynthesis protein PurH [Kiritimatiella glycovorans]
MNRIQRAIISVSDKAGVVEFARGLAEMEVELYSTGGTSRVLREAGLEVHDISELSHFPEILDGRVKTLVPQVHAGLLYVRDNADHTDTMKAQGMKSIDLVCVNLYPFESTVEKEDVDFDEAIEQIDIGGPTMIRSAAKNMKYVTVITEPGDYGRVLESMREHDGATTESLRLELGRKVFARMAQYNAAIASWLSDRLDPEGASGGPYARAWPAGERLRYGENAHQRAWLYRDPSAPDGSIAHAEVLHGKAMSYNNYVDGDAALEAVKELAGRPAVAVIKHTNPCGYATAPTLHRAFESAWSGDPVSAFGSVIAVTETVDLATAELLQGRFVEALIAPDFEADALEYLRNKSKNIRLIRLTKPMTGPAPRTMVKQVNGGVLLQDVDLGLVDQWRSVTQKEFPPPMRDLAEFGLCACKHVKSNAIVLVQGRGEGDFRVLGMGAGQPNRVDALRKLALTKARENLLLESPDMTEEDLESALSECVMISDAFFPFPDTVVEAAEAGVRYVIEPGGSKRDEEVIAACDERGVAMAFTGMRHFRH